MFINTGNIDVAYSLFKGKLSVASPSDNVINLSSMSDGRGSIIINGHGNTIDFLEGSKLNGNIVISGNGNKLLIGKNSLIRGQILLKGSKQKVSVGDHTTFQSVYILCQEGCNVEVGRWCMFSRDIEMRTTDAHSVVDVDSGKRLNTPASIKIGDHVWLSVGVLISKGVCLPEDTIVGAYSFVNCSFSDSGTVIAGTPAKVVKRGVTWNRGRKTDFTKEELNTWRE